MIDENILKDILITSSQIAATFVGIVGIFIIFRIETHDRKIYSRKHDLEFQHHKLNDLDLLEKLTKKHVQIITTDAAIRILDNMKEIESELKELQSIRDDLFKGKELRNFIGANLLVIFLSILTLFFFPILKNNSYIILSLIIIIIVLLIIATSIVGDMILKITEIRN